MAGAAAGPYVLATSSTEVEKLTSGSHVAYARKRRAERYRPERAGEAFVEFDLADGSHWRLSLLQIGALGLGFALDDGRPSLAIGTRVEGATIHACSLRIAGSLRIADATPEFAVGTICGAELTPATAADERKLALLLARLERRGHRSG